MLEVYCIYCRKTPGRAQQYVGADRLGRPIVLPCECPHCQGRGVVKVSDPRKSWRVKADEAQALAHVALAKWRAS
jgi:hypothetical protein